MATKKREQSESGFYHVFQRGVNHFDIFEDDDDREYYLDLLAQCAREYDAEIHAWCLMSNHTHLLLRASYESLSAMMRKLGSVYARRFNTRHCRRGHLFEGRFKSVCVETDAQFVSVMRYIHRNPAYHDHRTLEGDYPWSSYGEYAAAAPERCQIGFALALFGGVNEFVRFHKEERDHEIAAKRQLDIDTLGPMGDDEARRRANRALSEAGFDVSVANIGTLPRKRRDEAIACIKRAIKCSLRQLQRLTSIAYSAIRQAIQLDWVDTGEDDNYLAESPLIELAKAFGKPSEHEKPLAPNSTSHFPWEGLSFAATAEQP